MVCRPFYKKKNWDIVGGKVAAKCFKCWILEARFLMSGIKRWSHWYLKLKIQSGWLIELHPISLCNVLYNIVSKVLANRLKGILADIISPTQSVFVSGWLISDNILIAYEMNHYLLNKRKVETSYAAIKLDMSKAYDRVEWSLLEQMMAKMGFHSR